MHQILFAIFVILILYIIIKLYVKSKGLVYVMPANTERVISASSLGSVDGTTNNCTYSIWFYVNDWSVNYGEEKVIFQRSSTSSAAPDLSLYLGNYEQSLIVKTAIKSTLGRSNFVSGINKYLNPGAWCADSPHPANGVTTGYCWYDESPTTLTATSKSPEIERYNQEAMKICNNSERCLGYAFLPGWSGISYYENLTDSTDTSGSKSLVQGATAAGALYGYKKSATSNYKICTIPNIELQKWNNVILSATTNAIDIYINGNLVQSCDLEGEINIQNAGNIYLSPNNKGFNGWWPNFHQSTYCWR
jgi:hypothetical protein